MRLLTESKLNDIEFHKDDMGFYKLVVVAGFIG